MGRYGPMGVGGGSNEFNNKMSSGKTKQRSHFSAEKRDLILVSEYMDQMPR